MRVKISGFTFLRNARTLGYPFLESITSVLPLCDEYIIVLGESTDNTSEMIQTLNSPKIRIIPTIWNEGMLTLGYTYTQQANIALFNCTGDWAIYLQGDEVLHEKDLNIIREAMQHYQNDDRIEALVFDYLHFYGSPKYYAWSTSWYRRECRAFKNNRRTFSPESQFFSIIIGNRKMRYPFAALANASVYHYGWVRTEEQMNEKTRQVEKYWSGKPQKVYYGNVDKAILREFSGTHPAVMKEWLDQCAQVYFEVNPDYVLTKKDRRNRVLAHLEKAFCWDFSKKHYHLIG
jgi:glycosyltransferase involved in cell wall biosynthesis